MSSSADKKLKKKLLSQKNDLGLLRTKVLYNGLQGFNNDLKETAVKKNHETFVRQQLGLEDPYGDGDQSMVSGNKSQILRYQWAEGGDYSPFENRTLSDWCRDCYNGDLIAVKKHLENDPSVLERRESVLRFSGIFHVVAGAKTLIPAQPLDKEFLARVKPSTDHLACAKYLIEKGANIHARDLAGNTPLHSATGGYGNVKTLEIAKLLIKHGADVNAKNRMGCTPLFDPVMASRFDCVDFLLEYGAEVEVSENDGVSLTVLAKGFPKMASRISCAMAKKAVKQKAEAKSAGTYGTCACCKKTIETRRCSGCYMVWYCDVACQRKDWSNHKTNCKSVKNGYMGIALVNMSTVANISYMDRKITLTSYDHTGKNVPPNSHFIVKIQIPLDMVRDRMPPSEMLVGFPRDKTNLELLVYNKDKTLHGYIESKWEHYEELVKIIIDKGTAGHSKGYFCAFYHAKQGLKINISNIQLPQPW